MNNLVLNQQNLNALGAPSITLTAKSFVKHHHSDNKLKEKLNQLDQLKVKMQSLKQNIQMKRTSDKYKIQISKVQSSEINNEQQVDTIPRTSSSTVDSKGPNTLIDKAKESIRRSFQLTTKPLTQQRDLNVTSQISPHSYKTITPNLDVKEDLRKNSQEEDKLQKVLNVFKSLNEGSEDLQEARISYDVSEQNLTWQQYNEVQKGASIQEIPTLSPMLISFGPENFTKQQKYQTSNGFVYGKQLGRGKFGQVYLAKHIQTGCIVAIKRVLKQTIQKYNMVDRFIEQIRLHSKLDHPNIVKFYGFFQEKDSICIVLQYLNGGTLFDYLNEAGSLTLKEALPFLRQIIGALDYLHQKKIIHRDLKPENIVISSTGVAKICDFGWSAVVQTYRTTFCGTLDYASPEIIQHKEYNGSVDVWCVGVLTYELLIGRAPFESEDRQTVMNGIVNVNNTQLPYISCLPPQAVEFIEAILQKDPSQRPKIFELLQFPLFKGCSSSGIQAKGKKARKNTMG